MAQQTILLCAFEDGQGQGWATYDDVSGVLLSIRLINASPTKTIVFTAQRGTRQPQSFTAQPGSDTTFSLPSGQQSRYAFTQDPDGTWTQEVFTTSATWG